MKKILSIIVSAVMLVMLGACGISGGNNTAPDQAAAEPAGAAVSDASASNESKSIVIYFSATGTTKALAETIAETAGADIFEIVPSEPYTSEDLNYNNDNCRANLEMNDESARPAIADSIENIDEYDTIFLGYPIWWGTMPRIINTFLDTYDLSGKTVMPFCTSGGSGISTSVSAIRNAEPGADVKNGLRGSSSTTSNQIKEWLDNAGFNPTPTPTPTLTPTPTPTAIPTPTPTPTPTSTPDSSKVLVAYFSCTNNTEGIAKHILNAVDADEYEIVPEIPYTTADLNYSNSSCRANLEQNDASARPAISGSVPNMEDYDIIFLGYPIWWGQAPKIIYTFLESYNFGGKTIVPFCTSASSGVGSSAANLHSLCSDTVTWTDGRRFASGASSSTVVSWIDGLDLDLTKK